MAGSFANAPLRHYRRSIAAVESRNYSPLQISELAGALATIEYEAGELRKARRLLRKALEDPTENSVAQAEWMARNDRRMELRETDKYVARAFEAGAWVAVEEDELSRALELGRQWHVDEPFASRPAMFVSGVAAIGLGDTKTARAALAAARLVEPDNLRVLSQSIYCELEAGEVEAALGLMAELETRVRHLSSSERSSFEVLLAADRGMLAFRQGDINTGRQEYASAVELAAARGLDGSRSIALIHWYGEELLQGLAPTSVPDIDSLLSRLPVGDRRLYEAFIRRRCLRRD